MLPVGNYNISELVYAFNLLYIRRVPIIPLRGCIGFDWRYSGHQLQVKRQLVKLATIITAKKEDEIVLDEAEFALAA